MVLLRFPCEHESYGLPVDLVEGLGRHQLLTLGVHFCIKLPRFLFTYNTFYVFGHVCCLFHSIYQDACCLQWESIYCWGCCGLLRWIHWFVKMVVDRFPGHRIAQRVELFYVRHVRPFLDLILMRLDVMLDKVAPRTAVNCLEHSLDVGVGFTRWNFLGLLLKCK